MHNHCPGNAETVLDSSVDWRDVYFDRCWLAGEDAEAKMPGGTLYAAAVTYPIATFDGYSGKGCASGNPPTRAGIATGGVGEFFLLWATFWIYARDTDGYLCVYNNIGAAPGGDVYLWGVVGLTGDIGGVA
ncbi:MAG: hypothetical protein JRG91_20515 [Deltaproteobacteria bacterium]|nr:hypothetical protein [Deltaproteobacteria bacterium]